MPEVRIITERRPDGKTHVFFIDPEVGRKVDTGLKCGPGQDDVERTIRKLKLQLEKNGNSVTVMEK